MPRRPVTKKRTASSQCNNFRYAMSSMQGWRPTMEDHHRVSLSLPKDLNEWAYAGVFDGHSGDRVSKYAAENLLRKIICKISKLRDNSPDQVEEAIVSSFLNLDKVMETSRKIDDNSGSTAVCALISPTHLYIANCGDSRALVCRGGVQFATRDHKPNNKEEKTRIVKAGGTVQDNKILKSKAYLAVSRTLGDFDYKNNKMKAQCEQMVIPKPDVTVIERDAKDEFIVLACDGVFDVMSNGELISFIKHEMSRTNDLKTICNRVVDRSLEKGSTDNISVVILSLPGCLSKDELNLKRKLQLAKMNHDIHAKKARNIDDHRHQPQANAPLSNIDICVDRCEIAIHDENARPGGNGKLKNPFIIYFMDYWKGSGGNVCVAAKTCGERWKEMCSKDKLKYKRRYLYAKKSYENQNRLATD